MSILFLARCISFIFLQIFWHLFASLFCINDKLEQGYKTWLTVANAIPFWGWAFAMCHSGVRAHCPLFLLAYVSDVISSDWVLKGKGKPQQHWMYLMGNGVFEMYNNDYGPVLPFLSCIDFSQMKQNIDSVELWAYILSIPCGSAESCKTRQDIGQCECSLVC